MSLKFETATHVSPGYIEQLETIQRPYRYACGCKRFVDAKGKATRVLCPTHTEAYATFKSAVTA
jgi:hypothetical protein